MLYIVRGLPGSGKSTLAHKLSQISHRVLEADDYFMKDGVYQFDPSKLHEAHMKCQTDCLKYLSMGYDVVVANTFTRIWEMQPYLDMEDYPIMVITVQGPWTDEELAARTVHNVPVEAIAKMRARWENYDGR